MTSLTTTTVLLAKRLPFAFFHPSVKCDSRNETKM